MSDYSPPLDDIRLVLREISDIEGICELPGYEHVDVDTIDEMLEELGRFVAEVVAPVNRIGDSEGCSVEDGVVTMPEVFGEAWDQLIAAGWSAASQDPDYGGGGFPGTVQTVMTEMLATASRAWSSMSRFMTSSPALRTSTTKATSIRRDGRTTPNSSASKA